MLCNNVSLFLVHRLTRIWLMQAEFFLAELYAVDDIQSAARVFTVMDPVSLRGMPFSWQWKKCEQDE